MKNLIVYYSFTKNNEKIAEYLRTQLDCHIAKIEPVKKRSGLSILLDMIFNRKPAVKAIPYYPWNYDHIIFVAPIWAGKIATPLRSFLIHEKANIKSYSFITLCGGGNPKQKPNIQKELLSLTQKEPTRVLELWINDLLPLEKKNTIKYTSGYRIEEDGLAKFETILADFIKEENMVNAI
jgi:menaquinone-dependent protoporphyrinogen IX oxidase